MQLHTSDGNQVDKANGLPIKTVGSDALGFETLAVAASSVPLALEPATATKAFMTNETGQIRYRVDGAAPTPTVGHLVNVGDVIVLDSSGQIANFRAIAATATAATLQVTYF